jgi:hypothetical protein
VQSIDNNFIKGTETRDKPVLSTVQGYQILDGKQVRGFSP